MQNDSILSTGRARRATAARYPSRVGRWQAALAAIGAGLMTWLQGASSRRALLSLSDHELRDIGLSRADAERRNWKSFWQP
jgi:uncharacterized protein YjiS (DUF1127 family)